ncbi:MAG: glycosyltransferase family 39 protein, partial [Anaerolineae bacterium]|nr:glycosyltransferase family 39 protein [Anaerolineae bacterium]
ILRLIMLGERSLWYDEAFAVLFAEKGLDAMLYGTLTPVAGGAADIHPLLYYGTLNIWMNIFGQSAFAVRLWSALLGVVTVALIYLLARTLFNERTALAAALITAIAPFHVQYSQEARMYTLLGLLLVAATLCFIKGWRARGRVVWAWWLAFGLLAGMAMYTQQLAAFYLVALGLVPLLARRWRQMGGVIVGALVAVVVYLPWLVNLPSQFEKVRAYYWLTPPNPARPLLTLRTFTTVALDIPPPASMIAVLGALFLALFLVIQVIFYLRRRVQPDRKPLLFTLWLAAAPPALMWLVSQWQPVYLERSLLPSALLFYLALAWLLTRGGLPRPVAALISGMMLILAGIGLFYHYTWAQFPNSPFPAVAAHIRANWQPGDVIVHQNKLSALPLVFYARDLPQRYLGDAPGSPEDTLALPTQQTLALLADACMQVASHDARRIWWVIFADAERQYTAQGRPELVEAQAWLGEHYQEVEGSVFTDLNVILYDAIAASDWPPDCESNGDGT